MLKQMPDANNKFTRLYGIYAVLLLSSFFAGTNLANNALAVFFEGVTFPAYLFSIGAIVAGALLFFTGILAPIALPLLGYGFVALVAVPLTQLGIFFIGPLLNAWLYSLVLDTVRV